ncbi:MAG: response regulator transcription factor [Eubacterium sp.]|nr:response regulator transcription factor [Eubacterium sp.]HCA20836.1 DNA-binding response regulator [Lachnospiraceae bacterium]
MDKLIYAADDEPDILDVLREFLTNAGYNVKTFSTGDELLSCFRTDPCDLAVLDIMMPGSDGLTICKELRKLSDIPIVILTAKESESDQMRGYMFGGDDYLVKPFSPSLLVMKIKALLRRASFTDEDASDRPFGDIILSPSVHDVLCKGKAAGLSMTEYALIECLMNNPGTAVPRDKLLDDVWGIDNDSVETRVTDETVRRIRRKLTAAGSSVKITAVWGYGYKLEETR